MKIYYFIIFCMLIYSTELWGKSVRVDREFIKGPATEEKGGGGPGFWGYSWLDSDDPDPGAPTYNWVEISGIGSAVADWTPTSGYDADDEGYATRTIGFTFPYYFTDYATVYIHSNGHITFTQANANLASWDWTPIPDEALPNLTIYGYWADYDGGLGTGGSGTVYFWTNNIDSCVIQYNEWKRYGYTAKETFQIILLATGEIYLQYKTVGYSNSGTVGIECPYGKSGFEYMYDGVPRTLHSLLAIKYWFVRYDHNVAPTVVITPENYIDIAQFSPQATFLNLGTYTETFDVTCEIGTTATKFYSSTRTINNLDPLDTDFAIFDPFNPDSGEVYWVKFISELLEDENLYNDTLKSVAHAYYTPRMVLGELITSTTCGPCKAANDTLDDIYPDFSNWLSLIRYHGWWPSPGNDPFYLANVAENTARINYYGADYAPHLWIDGTVDGAADRDSWREMFQEEAEKKSPFEMNLFGTYNESKGDGTISTTITATGRPLFGNLRIRYAIVESDIYYVAPNGQRYFYQTFRDMLPNTAGVPLDINWKGVVSDTQDFTISGNWVEDNCDIVVFVQSDETKDVLQTARVSILDLLGLLLSVEEPEDTFQIVNLGDTAQFPFAVKNTKSFGDSVTLDIPDSLVNLPAGWDFYLHTGAAKDTFPQTIYLDPGEERTDLEVHITTLAVDTGTGTLTLMAQSNWNPAVVRSLRFTAHSEVGVEEAETIRLPLALSISPNPGFGNTNINYQIDKSGFVNLEVYDVTGRLVTTLVNEHKESGSYSMSWNPSSAGIYFYRLKTRDKVLTRKIILVK